MVDRHTVHGVVLCLLAFFLYLVFVAPLIERRHRPQEEPAPAEAPGPASPPKQTSLGPSGEPPSTDAQSPPKRADTPPPKTAEPPPKPLPEPELEDEIVRETDLFRVVLSNRGAAIRSVTLLDHTIYPEGKEPLELLTEIKNSPEEEGKLSLAMAVADIKRAGQPLASAERQIVPDLDTVHWEVVAEPEVPEGYSNKKAVAFWTEVPAPHLRITKTYLFKEPSYPADADRPIGGRDMELRVTVENRSDEPVSFKYALRTAAGIVPETDPDMDPDTPLELRESRDVMAVVGGLAGDTVKLETYPPKKADDGPFRHSGSEANPIYAGVKNRYFVAVVKPISEDPDRREITAVDIEKVGDHNVTATLELKAEDIPPGASSVKRFMVFVAPRKREILADYRDEQLEELLDYPWPAPITRVLSWLLRFFHGLIPNYGVAIILLTLLVRVGLHRLTLKSQKTAHTMQKIQPLIKEAQEKYKHDKQLQQREMMRIWKEQGASPLGGCLLPLVIQLPIFIGLWRMLYGDANLRHAPFVLWITDLSKADNLFTFGFSLLILGRWFNLLPILCAAAMLIQQRMSPKSPDPQAQQTQKMMQIMPVVLVVMLYKMPSGLMLYFFSSTLFGIVEQQFVRKWLDAHDAEQAAAAPPPVPVEQKRQKPAPHRRKKRRRKR